MPQSYTRLLTHIVFATKHRAQLITAELQPRLYGYLRGIVENENGRLLAAGGTADHVHLLVALHPQTAVADLMRLLKTNSSKWIHDTLPTHQSFAWQDGYAAFSVSESNAEHVRRYIERQQEHHRTTTFEEEFEAFLNRHGLDFNREYLWR